ncbi:MAG: nuclear transport factor 2 family protein [Proteobacteria bacterium]|nr:MAG: nuclear transport factor 2 family protein [Pseudomonadota bacterium]
MSKSLSIRFLKTPCGFITAPKLFLPAPLKKAGVRAFYTNIMDRTEIISFEPQQYIVEGNMVVVLGQEHQKVKRSGRELKQKWVQIYTVENKLITKMEEFATSEEVG